MFCIECHSQTDNSYYANPVVSGTEGMGGLAFVESFGTIYASNITPSALHSWSDGELIRAIAEGVSKNGDPLFPIMPSSRYRQMDQEDLYSVIAYVKALKPIENKVPKKRLSLPFKYIERTFPQSYEPTPAPPRTDAIAYGKYLATIADCIMCHTPKTKSGKPIEGMELAGGNEYPEYGGGTVISTNITIDIETGIGDWDEEFFIERFKEWGTGENISAEPDDNTVMPWISFSGMTEEDLRAIFAYIQSVKPVTNKVE